MLGNGLYPNENKMNHLIENSSYIVCVNGGSKKAKELKIKPDIIIGDLDSADSDSVAYFRNLNVPIQKIPSQEENDLEKALMFLIKKGFQRVVLCGFLGEREDQTISTLQLAKKYVNKIDSYIISNRAEIFLLRKGNYKFPTEKNQIISILGFPHAYKVTTNGLKYPLKDENLFEGSRGISNQATKNSVQISLKAGTLIVVKQMDLDEYNTTRVY
jgi:thiamine pyrophosphokinase